MYCIKCGVELADSEKRCPLCDTEVYHPDIYIKHTPSPYPDVHDRKKKMSKKGVVFSLSLMFVIPMIVLLLVDMKINGCVTWSGIANLAILLGYAVAVLPMWFKRPNPVVFVPLDFALAGGYLLYINEYVDGTWFLSFAFPVSCIFLVIATAATVLFKYLRRGRLYIIGGLMFSLGGACMLIEMFVNITFEIRNYLIWSPYPAGALGLIGACFILIAVCKPLRETFTKKFFI